MTKLLARDAGRAALREHRDALGATANLDRYRTDPFAHLDDGHAMIPDLVTLEPVEFHPFDHQREIIDAWMDLELLRTTGVLRYRNVHEEKSRQMGGTWIVAWGFLWSITYHAVPLLAMHLDLSEIDDGGRASTLDSFFGKIRYMHERLPLAYKAPLHFRQNPSIIRNDALGPSAFISGEGATPDPGRGGRYGGVFMDEAARISWGEKAHAALSRACPEGRLYNSTPEGEGNVYFRLRDERPQGYRFLRHHWSVHPYYGDGVHVAGDDPGCAQCAALDEGLRWSASDPVAHRYPGKLTSPWYEQAVLDLTDEQVAAELDIDYTGSLVARVYSEFNEEQHVLEGIAYDHALPVSFAFDYGLDVTAVAVLQESPSEVRQIAELEISDATPDGVCPELIDLLADVGMPLSELRPQFLVGLLAVGDPAGEGRDLATGKPLVAQYRRHGFAIDSKRYPTIAPTITATKRLLLGKPKRYVVSRERCPRTIRHWKNNRWPVDRHGARKAGASKPVDDEHNHMMRAIAYYASYRFPPPGVQWSVARTPLELVGETGRHEPRIHAGMKF